MLQFVRQGPKIDVEEKQGKIPVLVVEFQRRGGGRQGDGASGVQLGFHPSQSGFDDGPLKLVKRIDFRDNAREVRDGCRVDSVFFSYDDRIFHQFF